MKHALTVLIAVIMTQLTLAQTTTADGFVYTSNGTAITITGYIGAGGAIIIPVSIDGVPVDAIGDSAFYNKSSVTSVAIPSGIKKIGSAAFYNCIGIESVSISETVTAIGSQAFQLCTALTAFTVEASNLFYSAGTYREALFNKQKTTLIYYAIGLSGHYVIPNGVAVIGYGSFYGATMLSGVSIPSSVTTIESQAFSGGCGIISFMVDEGNPNYSNSSDRKALLNKNQTVLIQFAAGSVGDYSIPSGITGIGNFAFYGSRLLQRISIPDGVNQIGVQAFFGCSTLSELFIPNTVTQIGDQAFSVCSNLTSLKLPDTISKIGFGLFAYCSSLINIIIPSRVTNIESQVFSGCGKLSSVVFLGSAPAFTSVTFIGSPVRVVNYLPSATGWTSTFAGLPTQAVASSGTTADGFAYSLLGAGYSITGYTGTATTLTIPATINGLTVTAIADSAFSGKTTITGIVIPDSVMIIGQSCFSGCANLAGISLGAGVTDIAYTAFIFLGKLTNISVASSNAAFSSSTDGRVLFNKSKTRIVKYASGVAGGYLIPIGVTELGPYSFFHASGLTDIVIPNGVTWINDHVFTGCTGIASLTIPASVNRISCCQSFSSVTLNKILFLGNKPTTGGSSSDFTGSGIAAIHYAENATGWGATFAGYPTVAVKPTSITAPPASVSIVSSDRAELRITATGAAPLTYQWYQGASGTTTAPISGATSTTFLTPALTATTSYWVRVTDANGFVTYSPTAMVAVSATSPLTVTHTVVGAGYQAGGGVIVTNIITYTGTAPSSITWDTLLPTGWTYLGSGGSEGSAAKPTYKTGDLLEWTWSNVPASPFEFTYIASVPAGTIGDQFLVSLVTSQHSGTNNQMMARPDPLVIRSASMHSSDANRDGRIGLLELTRVIELYNYRSGTTRTGAYHAQGGTEDGFAPGPAGLVSAGFVPIPGGTFVMGSVVASSAADTSDNLSDALPHTVTLAAFYLAATETTWADWLAVRAWAGGRGYTDLGLAGAGKADAHPVHSVSWYDVVKWCNAKSEKEGLTPVYYADEAQTVVYRTGEVNVTNGQVKWRANGYRLPTEAEWEYAARGGVSGQRFPWGDTITHAQANYNSNAGYAYDVSATRGKHPSFSTGGEPYTSPVGFFAANGYGVWDMAGNVWEWCWDRDGPYGSAAVTDPRGSDQDMFPTRLGRGGSWLHDPFGLRSAYRSNNHRELRYNHIGFRPARSLVP